MNPTLTNFLGAILFQSIPHCRFSSSSSLLWVLQSSLVRMLLLTRLLLLSQVDHFLNQTPIR